MTDGGLDDVLWCIEQIRTAKSGREIAAYVLRIPDAIVVTHGAQLQAECLRASPPFAAAGVFISLREANLHLVRDAHGLVPTSFGLELEMWRETLSRFAAGHPEPLPAFMQEAQRVANGQ